MQCKDIEEGPILKFLADRPGVLCTWGVQLEPQEGTMPSVGQVMLGIPPKLQLAKMSQMIKKGLVDGCACGCRGEFCLPGEVKTKGEIK